MDYKQIATRPNKTVYRDGDVCYKVFAADYNKADILNEALNQARVEQTGLFVPKVRQACHCHGLRGGQIARVAHCGKPR